MGDNKGVCPIISLFVCGNVVDSSSGNFYHRVNKIFDEIVYILAKMRYNIYRFRKFRNY